MQQCHFCQEGLKIEREHGNLKTTGIHCVVLFMLVYLFKQQELKQSLIQSQQKTEISQAPYFICSVFIRQIQTKLQSSALGKNPFHFASGLYSGSLLFGLYLNLLYIAMFFVGFKQNIIELPQWANTRHNIGFCRELRQAVFVL